MMRHETVTACDAGALIDWAAGQLGGAGIETPRREAYLLLAHASGMHAGAAGLRDRAATIADDAVASFKSSVALRAGRMPLAYITGRQGFWTLDLAVSAATLIPRADSEALIECLRHLRPDRTQALRMLDLGTGTGCLLLAALSEYPNGTGVGIDLSPAACALAASNSRRNALAGRARFLCANWNDALGRRVRFDLVLSNPPYVRADALGALMPEVSRFEPPAALDGGEDGLAAYRAILPRLGDLLAPGAVSILELGAGQSCAVRALAGASGLVPVRVQPDLGGLDRAMALRLA